MNLNNSNSMNSKNSSFQSNSLTSPLLGSYHESNPLNSNLTDLPLLEQSNNSINSDSVSSSVSADSSSAADKSTSIESRNNFDANSSICDRIIPTHADVSTTDDADSVNVSIRLFLSLTASIRHRRYFVFPATIAICLACLGLIFSLSEFAKPIARSQPDWHSSIVSRSVSIQGAVGGIVSALLGEKIKNPISPVKSLSALPFYALIGSIHFFIGFELAGLAVNYNAEWLFYLGLGFINGIGYGILYFTVIQHFLRYFPDILPTMAGLFGGLIGTSAMCWSEIHYLLIKIPALNGPGNVLYLVGLLAFVVSIALVWRFEFPVESNLIKFDKFHLDILFQQDKLIHTDSMKQIHSIDQTDENSVKSVFHYTKYYTTKSTDSDLSLELRELIIPLAIQYSAMLDEARVRSANNSTSASSVDYDFPILSKRDLLFHTRPFWLICVFVTALLIPGWGLSSMYETFFETTSESHSESIGTNLTAFANGFYTLGRVLWGGIAQRIGTRMTYRLCSIGQVVLFLLFPSMLSFKSSSSPGFTSSYYLFYAFCCFSLTLYGGAKVLLAPVLMEYIGIKNSNNSLGLSLLAVTLAAIIGPAAIDALKKSNGDKSDFDSFFYFCAAVSFVGLLAVEALRPIKKVLIKTESESETNGNINTNDQVSQPKINV